MLKEQQSINHARTRTRTRTRTYYLPALAGATPLRRDYFRVPSNRNYDSFTPTLTAHSQVNRTEQNEQATPYAYTGPSMDTITLLLHDSSFSC